MKLLHVSQLLRITCAAARRKNCGGGGFCKFRLAWRRAYFFPASAARQGASWRRRRNSAAEGSTGNESAEERNSRYHVIDAFSVRRELVEGEERDILAT